jgi:hypothetical protein
MTDKIMSSSITATPPLSAVDAENNNNGNRTAAINALGINNNASNRKSVIADIQKQLFPQGKLPPTKTAAAVTAAVEPSGHGKSMGTFEANMEPKMEMNSAIGNRGESADKKLTEILNSRTRIAPTNKRPPSKVVS